MKDQAIVMSAFPFFLKKLIQYQLLGLDVVFVLTEFISFVNTAVKTVINLRTFQSFWWENDSNEGGGKGQRDYFPFPPSFLQESTLPFFPPGVWCLL